MLSYQNYPDLSILVPAEEFRTVGKLADRALGRKSCSSVTGDTSGQVNDIGETFLLQQA